ncbi:hypothetical protein BG015_001241 [Linnemannia schmuckeri]|uniref:3CxxC-type domain-containing protein n=1 Tax=Linnemannia schmuckeri TaxID=64567 RepID=A0A9P5VDW0_9FUNG|nr:hypothetical protein BG015_001241 [Linnemannia schmuckeri]
MSILTLPAIFQKQMTRSKKPKVEIDAAKHHDALARVDGGDQYKYDPTLTAAGCRKVGVRFMSGLFFCYVCQPNNTNKPRVWSSGKVCTELYLSKDKTTYRAVFNAQQCQVCDRYGRFKVKEKKYVDKVLDTFALWTGQREAYESEFHKSTGPHDSSRCYGCLKGICVGDDDDDADDGAYTKKNSKKNRRRRRR